MRWRVWPRVLAGELVNLKDTPEISERLDNAVRELLWSIVEDLGGTKETQKMNKTGIKSLIVAEKVKLNDAISGFNNLAADLIPGKAVYEVFSDRAMENRVLACKSRILSLPNQTAPKLVRKTKEAIIEELSEHLRDALKQLSDLSESELSWDVVLEEPAAEAAQENL